MRNEMPSITKPACFELTFRRTRSFPSWRGNKSKIALSSLSWSKYSSSKHTGSEQQDLKVPATVHCYWNRGETGWEHAGEPAVRAAHYLYSGHCMCFLNSIKDFVSVLVFIFLTWSTVIKDYNTISQIQEKVGESSVHSLSRKLEFCFCYRVL